MSVRYLYDRATGTEMVLCLSTDTKPSSANGVGLFEQDTGKTFYRAGGAWVEKTGSAQPTIQFKDEGVNAGSSGGVTTVDFVGGGVTASESGGTLTVTIGAGAYSDEQAQDAVGAMVDASLTYVDATPLLQRAALTGDVTASAGSNSTTIANDAVTYAKMQNTSAADVLLGRGNGGGAGDVQEITLGTSLSMTGTTLNGTAVPAAASQAEQETGSSTTVYTSPGRQHFHASAAKFWVYWTGNSTTILASYNTTSIADTAVGDADVTIATDFSSANWAGFVCTNETGTDGWDADSIQSCGFNARAAGTCGVLCGVMIDGATAVGNLTDPDQWQVVGFGDHT